MASSSQELNQQIDTPRSGKEPGGVSAGSPSQGDLAGGAIVVHPSGVVHPLNQKQASRRDRQDDEYGEEAIATSRTSNQNAGLFTRIEAWISRLSSRNTFWHRVCSLIWLPYAFRS